MGIGYSVAASIITAILTQLLNLWLYQNVIQDDLKRKTRMLKKNMLALDIDQIPMYKIRLRKVMCVFKCLVVMLPNKLKKYIGKLSYLIFYIKFFNKFRI
jgi:hypothetical protein